MLIGALLPLLLMFFGVHMVTVLLVGLGQAHFIHCYVYQYRAGKMDADFFAKWVFGLTTAGAACFLLGDDVIIPAALIFILHQFFDDMYLYRKSISRTDYAQLGLVLTACATIALFEADTVAHQIAAVAMLLSLGIGLIAKERHIFWTLSIPFGLPLFYVLWNYQQGDWLIPLGIIIMSHYLRWLIHVYQHRSDTQKPVFFTEALILNMMFVLYAVATVSGVYHETLSQLLQGLFSLQAFVIWTMAHIASTMRPRWLSGIKKPSA